MTGLNYPPTRTQDTTDSLGGVSFPDPYRWLEQDNDEVRAWQRAQAALASAYVREWPSFERLRDLVGRFNVGRRAALPRFAGGLWFRMRVADGATQACALVSSEPFGEGRVLFDPRVENPQHPPFLSWISPSPDGSVLAVGVCGDGSESNTIRLIDAKTGSSLPNPPPQILMDNASGGAQWLPDGTGFFFTAMEGVATDLTQKVYLHRLRPSTTTELTDIPWLGGKEWRMVVVCADGRHAVALERMNTVVPIAIAELGCDDLDWRPFVNGVVGTVAGHVVGDRYIAITDVGADRGRLIAIALDAAAPNDPATWTELLGETDAVMHSLTVVGGLLYLTELVDAYARIRIVDIEGRVRGEVPLPGRGAVSAMSFPIANLVPKGHPEKFLFAFSTLTQSWGIYSHTPGTGHVEVLQPPACRLERAEVEERTASSSDGTAIPYRVVRLRGLRAGPQPTLIYAYGGFNVPFVPQFPGMAAAFVAAGGAFVHAHLRGGGEFGRAWWEGGRYANKQKGYEDLYAVAEDLIVRGDCAPHTLAVTGESNGGLMAAVAATQRPDLWAVAVPRVPRLDLIGACRTGYGRRSTLEDRTPTPDDPSEARRLATFSPYHLVRDGVRYPAIFIDAGDTDPRCPPQDARKFAARMQRCSSSARPVLLHVWENVGHGWATDKQTQEIECTEWLAFVLRQLEVGL